jgi:hypothetical protein
MILERTAILPILAVTVMNLSVAAEPWTNRARVVRIHDYAGVSVAAIDQTQRFVAKVYDAAGVQIRWASTRSHSRGWRRDTTAGTEDMSVLVLNRRMADGHTTSRQLLGFAAISPSDGGGRVAYAFYDRIEATARTCDCAASKVLSIVIAHELGHLLLPSGSHSTGGLMRKSWGVQQLRQLDLDSVRLTSAQAEDMRRTINRIAMAIAP